MTERDNLFYAISSLCNYSSIVERLVSLQPMTRCFQWLADLKTVQAMTGIEYTVYQKRSLCCIVKQMFMHCIGGNWSCSKHPHFLSNGLDWLYGFTGLTSQCVCPLDVSHWRMSRSCMPFSMTLSSPLIIYFYGSGWMLTIVEGDITERKSTFLIRNYSASTEFQHSLLSINSYLRHNTIFWENSDLTKGFPNEKFTTQLFFMLCFSCHFPSLRHCNELKC